MASPKNTTFELTISPDYVPNWGTWEATREFIQNCLDGHQAGYPSDIRYDFLSNTLHLFNKGAELKPEHLVLGITTKGEGSFRGKFGEGFKLAMIVLCRQARCYDQPHIPVEIQTGKNIWRPSIAFSAKFGTELLNVDVSTTKDCGGLLVSIPNIQPDEWLNIRTKVLNLNKDYSKIRSIFGDILLDEEHRGQLYVKDLWVSKLPDESSYGYNLKHAELDRDRRMADSYTVRHCVANILESTITSRQLDAVKFVDCLDNDACLEARALAWHSCSSDFKKIIANAWLAKHPEAIPVEGMVEASEVHAFGRKACITSKVVINIIGDITGTHSKLKSENHFAINRFVPPEELTEAQTLWILSTCIRFQNILQEKVDVSIVEFANDQLLGLWKEDRILISLKCLISRESFIDTLIHELGHRNGAPDLTAEHMNEVTLIASRLIHALI